MTHFIITQEKGVTVVKDRGDTYARMYFATDNLPSRTPSGRKLVLEIADCGDSLFEFAIAAFRLMRSLGGLGYEREHPNQ